MADLKIINYDSNGITSRSLQEIYSMLVNKVKEIYGVDVDITPDNADGIIQRMFATFLSEVAVLSEKVYHSLNLDSAQGIQLEALCALANVYRRSAAATRGVMTLSLPSSITVPSGQQIKIVDANNIVWYGPIETTNHTYEDEDLIELECSSFGDMIPVSPIIAIYADTIALLTGSFAFSSFVVESLGSMAESDAELRSRRYRMGVGMYSGSLVDSIVNSILSEFPIVSDALIYNNNTGEDKTINLPNAATFELPDHDLAVFVRPKYGSVLSNAIKIQIADVLKRKITPGIHTWFNTGVAPAGYVEQSFSVEGHTTWTEKYTFFEAQQVEPQVNILVQALPGFDIDAVRDRIRIVLIELSRSYRINQTLYSADLFEAVNSVNMSQGTPTFKVLNITFGVGSPTSSVDTRNGYWFIDGDTVINLTT